LEEILYGRTYVVSVEVVDVGLGKHGVVLQLTLAKRRGVASCEIGQQRVQQK